MNGVVEIMNLLIVNGDPPNNQQPPLFDMDLEKMHTELQRGRYLTPQDFPDDVGTMSMRGRVKICPRLTLT